MNPIAHIGAHVPTVRTDSSPEATSAAQAGRVFDEVLASARVNLSQHAARRLSRRGIEVNSAQARRLVTAIDRAAAKGSRTSLVLMDELALLVRIPERTVVTAMSPGAMRDGVVTQIDSAVMI
jgi:flagellar operon protein